MLAGLALHALGFAAQQARLSILALLVFAWGVVRLGGGRRWGAAAVFPLGFMVFAIPINVLDSAGFWLRMWVIDASSGLAKAAGIAVMQSGTQLLAPDGRYNYDVAAACSGVRSLTALAALSLLAGYLNFRAWWRRGLVLLLCFPLVYLGNVARISAIIFAAQLGGQAWGERAHEVMGSGVFVIVLGGVLAAVNALRRWAPEAGNAAGREQTCHSLDDNNGERPGRGERPVCHLMDDKMVGWAAVVIVGLAAGEMVFLHHLSNSPARGQVGVVLAADGQNPVELPAFIGHDWIGRRAEVTPVEREILPPDTGFFRWPMRKTRCCSPSCSADAIARRSTGQSYAWSGRVGRSPACLDMNFVIPETGAQVPRRRPQPPPRSNFPRPCSGCGARCRRRAEKSSCRSS
jgi:exosortase